MCAPDKSAQASLQVLNMQLELFKVLVMGARALFVFRLSMRAPRDSMLCACVVVAANA